VEHEVAGVWEAHLEHGPLGLALDDRVGELDRRQRRPSREVVEEVPVDVERVDRVVLEDVHEVDPDRPVALDRDRLVDVVERDRVDRVDLVALGVEVRVEAVHHHHQLVGLGTPALRIDDEGAVQAAGDVLRERAGVAVVEMEPERLGVELVNGVAAGLDQAGAEAGDPVHRRRMQPVEVDRVRVLGAVDEADPEQLALVRAERRPWDAVVVCPSGVLDAGGDLDLLVTGKQGPFAKDPAARETGRLAVVEVAQHLGRVEAVGGVVDDLALLEGRAGVAASVDRRGAPVGRGAVRVGGLRALERLVDAGVRDEAVDDRDGRARGAADQELASVDLLHCCMD
jgi:hypothetical protein